MGDSQDCIYAFASGTHRRFHSEGGQLAEIAWVGGFLGQGGLQKSSGALAAGWAFAHSIDGREWLVNAQCRASQPLVYYHVYRSPQNGNFLEPNTE